MTKRLRVEDKKIMEGVLDTIKKNYWIDLQRNGGIAVRSDGTFALKMRKHCTLRKKKIEELLELANRVRDCMLKFECVDERLVITMERMYPEECYKRRAQRAECQDEFWKYLDLDAENAKVVTAKVMWSNELALIKAFDSNSMIIVDPVINRIKILKEES